MSESNPDPGGDPKEELERVRVAELAKWIEPVDPDDPVTEPIRRLEDQVEDMFPVVKEGELVGVVTVTDLSKTLKMPSTGGTPLTGSSVEAVRKYLGRTVEDLMTRDPLKIDTDEDVWRAVELMLNYEFRNVPTTEGTSLEGVLSMRDVLRYCEECSR